MNSAVCPMTCDHCQGMGKKANMLASLAWIITMIVLTVGPFVLVWAL